MEVKGRIIKLLPSRNGVSTRTGNPWKALPFVLEYYENENDRYSNRVLLETFDTNIMGKLAKFVVTDANGTAIIEDAEIRMTQPVEAICGFAHTINEYTGRIYNEVRLYKMEVLTEEDKTESFAPVPQPTPAPQPQQTAQELINSFANLEPVDKLPF